MIYYVSRTGTRRNLAAIREAGFRLLVSRAGVWRTEGFAYCIDNGVYADFRAWIEAAKKRGLTEEEAVGLWIAGGWREVPFDDEAFEKLLDKLGAGADFIVLPDIVAGGLASLELSLRWMNRCRAVCDLVLIAVQDGMEPEHLDAIVGPNVGIFLGGSTEWKLARMGDWGGFCAGKACHYHVARVNTVRRIFQAIAAGASSGDGSSAARFARTVPLLQGATAHQDLLSPRRAA